MRHWLVLFVVASCGGELEGNKGLASGIFTPCGDDSDCVVVPQSCCGSCGLATKTDLIAIAKIHAGDYRHAVCAGKPCPACGGPIDPSLTARCKENACELVP